MPSSPCSGWCCPGHAFCSTWHFPAGAVKGAKYAYNGMQTQCMHPPPSPPHVPSPPPSSADMTLAVMLWSLQYTAQLTMTHRVPEGVVRRVPDWFRFQLEPWPQGQTGQHRLWQYSWDQAPHGIQHTQGGKMSESGSCGAARVDSNG
jgi:hypothetical protein